MALTEAIPPNLHPTEAPAQFAPPSPENIVDMRTPEELQQELFRSAYNDALHLYDAAMHGKVKRADAAPQLNLVVFALGDYHTLSMREDKKEGLLEIKSKIIEVEKSGRRSVTADTFLLHTNGGPKAYTHEKTWSSQGATFVEEKSEGTIDLDLLQNTINPLVEQASGRARAKSTGRIATRHLGTLLHVFNRYRERKPVANQEHPKAS